MFGQTSMMCCSLNILRSWTEWTWWAGPYLMRTTTEMLMHSKWSQGNSATSLKTRRHMFFGCCWGFFLIKKLLKAKSHGCQSPMWHIEWRLYGTVINDKEKLRILPIKKGQTCWFLPSLLVNNIIHRKIAISKIFLSLITSTLLSDYL